MLPLSTGGNHRFDIVSTNRTIVGEIKSSGVRESSSKRKVGVGTIKSIYYDLYLLNLVTATRKLMILTNPGLYLLFSDHCRGKILPDIDLRLIELPPNIESEIESARRSARKEKGI